MIKGLSDRLRLPRRGKIRLGEKRISKKTGKEHPVSLDYFVVTDEVKEIYGEKPRELDVMLPMETRENFFPQHYKMYGKSQGLLCRGDGEMAMKLNTDGSEMSEVECLGKDCEFYKGKKVNGYFYQCKQIGNLQVILPKIKGLGIYQIDTSSYNSIVNLNSGIEMIRGMLGRVSWVPLVLKVEMQEAHPLVNDKRIKTIIPVMSLTANITVEELINRAKVPLATTEWKTKKSIQKSVLTIPEQLIELDNPDIDKKPDLLYSETAKEPAEEKVSEQDESPFTKETDLDAEIEALFNRSGFPAGRRKIWEDRHKDKKELIEALEKYLKEKKPEKPAEEQKPSSKFITFHNLNKKLIEIGWWEENDYKAFVEDKYGKKSSKELTEEELDKAIRTMSESLNKELGGKGPGGGNQGVLFKKGDLE